MKKRIVVGSLRQETNSFSQVKTMEKDFIVYKGDEMLQHVAVTPFFSEKGVEIIPTLCAYAMPSGKVDEKTYLSYKNYIIDHIPQGGRVDGVWLYLHGAMNVENIGSGEALLVSEVREKVGPDVPVAVALDFHANNTDLLAKSANIVYGYRTAPHVDYKETQLKAAELLLKCIDENIHAESVMVRPPLLFPGEMVTTGVEPTKSLINELDIAEKEEGVICASIFSGMPWTDAPNAGASVVVVGKKGYTGALKQAKRLAKLFWDAREEFKFEEEAAEPEDAVKRAIRADEELIFISDSGDNVTAGAAGDNTYLLSILLEKKVEKILVAGITDSRVVSQFSDCNIGDSLNLKLGGELDNTGKTIRINSTLKRKGSIGGKGKRSGTDFVLINVDGIDIIITDTRYSFTSPEIIECTGVQVYDYKIIVVKLGYIYPELRKISKRSIMALTPGSSCLTMDSFGFHHINRPMFPVDKDFEWEP